MSDSPRFIVGLGEVLWDVFADGPRFGGAPANFACSVSDLATGKETAAVASAVGSDPLGVQAIQELKQRDVRVDWVQRPERPTGQVHVTLDGAGQASYQFAEDTAWDQLQWTDELAELAASAAAVCFGTLGQRSEVSRQTIRRFLESVPPSCLRVCDINLRPPYWSDEVVEASLKAANALKCNENELPTIARICGMQGDPPALLNQLQQRFDYRLIALTLGEEGSLVLDADGQLSQLPAVATDVIDTVGAGDSLTAAVVLGTLRGLPTRELHDWATRVSAYVCSHAGATPGGLPRPEPHS